MSISSSCIWSSSSSLFPMSYSGSGSSITFSRGSYSTSTSFNGFSRDCECSTFSLCHLSWACANFCKSDTYSLALSSWGSFTVRFSRALADPSLLPFFRLNFPSLDVDLFIFSLVLYFSLCRILELFLSSCSIPDDLFFEMLDSVIVADISFTLAKYFELNPEFLESWVLIISPPISWLSFFF